MSLSGRKTDTEALSLSPTRFDVAAIALLALAVVIYQFAAGAYSGEIARASDEPAHVVGGLMIREYLAQGFPTTPLRFAEDYYVHYPQIGIGNWPPGFHLIEGLWTLAFPPSRAAFMALLALISTGLLAAVYSIGATVFGRPLALAAAGMLLLYPAYGFGAICVMTDTAGALFVLLAAIAFVRYMECPSSLRSALWTAAAVMAIMTRGSGMALAFVPPLAVVFSRRFDLLRKWSFWLPAAVVAAIALPWYFATEEITRATWSPRWYGAGLAMRTLSHVGPGLLPGALAGLWLLVIQPARKTGSQCLHAVLGALFIGWLAFHMALPAGRGDRKHMVSVAVALLLTTAVADRIARMIGDRWRTSAGRWAVAFGCLAALACLVLVREGLPNGKQQYGYATLAARLVEDTELAGGAVLVSSAGIGERALIAEIALLRPKPEFFVVRASQFLSRASWNGSEYTLIRSSVPEILEALETVPISTVVVDQRPGHREDPAHHGLLQAAMVESPERWRPWHVAPAHPAVFRVYRRVGGPRPVTGGLAVESRTAGRVFRSSP